GRRLRGATLGADEHGEHHNIGPARELPCPVSGRTVRNPAGQNAQPRDAARAQSGARLAAALEMSLHVSPDTLLIPALSAGDETGDDRCLTALDLARLAPRPPPEMPPEMPRERLWRSGARAISDAELLALVLGTGVRDHPVLAVALDLLRSAGGLASLSRST